MNYNILLSNVIANAPNDTDSVIDVIELMDISDFKSHEFYEGYISKFSFRISDFIRPKYIAFFNMQEFVMLWASTALSLYYNEGVVYIDQHPVLDTARIMKTLECIEKMCYSELMTVATEFLCIVLNEYFGTREDPLLSELIKIRIPVWKRVTNETISDLD